jgi:hypothetical protein
MDGYGYFIRLAVNLHQGDTGISVLGLDGPAQLHVFL